MGHFGGHALANLLTVANAVLGMSHVSYQSHSPLASRTVFVPTCASPADEPGEPRHECDGAHACHHHLRVGNTFEYLCIFQCMAIKRAYS